MKITYKKAPEESISKLRGEYFNHLSEPQELFLEMFIWNSAKYMICINERTIGYFIISKDNLLAEYYIADVFLPSNEEIFKDIIQTFKIQKAYCKSFDLLMVKSCITFSKFTKVIGHLFRNYNTSIKFIENEMIKVRLATLDDFPVISNIKEGLFDFDEEIKYVLENNNMFIYSLNNSLIGCGIFQQTLSGYNNYDIGMLVHPDERKKGYGVYIIQHLKQFCLANNWRPTCGCAVENIASKKTLEKAGFVTKYSMLEFNF